MIFGPRTSSNEAAFQALRGVCVEVATSCVEFGKMPPSDDVSFQTGGIPAVSIATVSVLQAHQLWLFMNGGEESGLEPGFTPLILRTIHTPADAAGLVDRDAMARAYRILAALVARLGGK